MSARVEHTVSELHGQPAGVVTRTIAGAVDYGFVWTSIGVGYLGWAILGFLIDPRRFHWPAVPVPAILTAGFAFMVAYLWLAWATRGKTLGGVLLGTRVVSIGGGRVDPVRAFLRAVFVAVFPIGLFTCALTPGSRSLHDLPTGTKVVYHYRSDEIASDDLG